MYTHHPDGHITRCQFTAFIATALLATISTMAAAQDNPIKNPGFESQTPLEFWTHQNSSATGSQVVVSGEEALGGSVSAKFTTGISPGAFARISQTELALTANKDYVLTFWVKRNVDANNTVAVYGTTGTGEKTPLGIDAKNNSQNTMPSQGKMLINEGSYAEWTEISYHFNTGATYTDYIIEFQVISGGRNRINYIDDCVIMPAVATAIQDEPALASAFVLHQNYPNPFNPSTTITFELPVAGHVSLKVFDTIGRNVATLVAASMTPGSYRYTWDGSGQPSGLYLYRLQSGAQSKTGTMMLLK